MWVLLVNEYSPFNVKWPNNQITLIYIEVPQNNFSKLKKVKSKMANSKLLKEAIADAKAVRETAIANAKIALEEAFTPRLQSILSRKLQAEMEGEEEVEEELDSSDIGDGDEESPVEPSNVASDAHTELGPESEEETAEVGDELEEGDHSEEEVSEEEEIEEVDGVGYDDPTNADDAEISEEEGEEEIHSEEEEIEEEDELDLESIIRELEMGMEEEDEVSEEEDMDSEEEVHEEEDEVHEEDEIEDESEEEVEADEVEAEEEDEMDDEIDLDEILREMGYGDDEEVSEEEHEDSEMEEKYEELEKDLEEAYATIKTLQGTINEVNLLNAKLLYANRLFRAYNLNNEQKSKVVENLDRTSSVREVKLVYATLAESMNFTGTEKKTKKVVAEAASKPVASTAPAKEIISENTNALAERFKQLANIK